MADPLPKGSWIYLHHLTSGEVSCIHRNSIDLVEKIWPGQYKIVTLEEADKLDGGYRPVIPQITQYPAYKESPEKEKEKWVPVWSREFDEMCYMKEFNAKAYQAGEITLV